MANPPNTAQLECTPYHSPQVTSGSVCSSVGIRRGTGRQTQLTDTQTAVTNIHFASAMPHAKCNRSRYVAFDNFTEGLVLFH